MIIILFFAVARPSVKPPPPPTPARSISNTNLSSIASTFGVVNTALVQSATKNTSEPTPPPQSSNMVSIMRDQFRVGASGGITATPTNSVTDSPKSTLLRERINPIILNGGPINPPAPPPHRTCPPPPPPQRQSSNVSSHFGIVIVTAKNTDQV